MNVIIVVGFVIELCDCVGGVEQFINILVVDDELVNLLVLEMVLDDFSYCIVWVMLVDQVLCVLMVDEFVVLVLDIQLFDMNGIDFVQMIKECKKMVYFFIIFLIVYFDQDQYCLQGYGIGVVDYLYKLVNVVILCFKVVVFVELYCKMCEIQCVNMVLLVEVEECCCVEERLCEFNEMLEWCVIECIEVLLQVDCKLQVMMSSIIDGLFFIEYDGYIGYVNEQGVLLFGWYVSELVGWYCCEVFGIGVFEVGFECVVSGCQVVFFEVMVCDGSECWL